MSGISYMPYTTASLDMFSCPLTYPVFYSPYLYYYFFHYISPSIAACTHTTTYQRGFSYVPTIPTPPFAAPTCIPSLFYSTQRLLGIYTDRLARAHQAYAFFLADISTRYLCRRYQQQASFLVLFISSPKLYPPNVHTLPLRLIYRTT